VISYLEAVQPAARYQLMDPIGFAVGSISGAATLFDSCIECLKYISAAQKRDRDYRILEIKFEFERERFYQLGKVMGLNIDVTDTSRQPSAVHDGGQPLDSRTTAYLDLVKSLIEDVEVMRQRYGLREAASTGETAPKPIGRIFQKLLKRSDRKENNLSHPVRWVIQDKEKFEGLVEDLKSLNDIFEDTVASHARLSTYRRELHKEIQSCTDTDALEILSMAYMGNENGISDVASQQISALEDRLTSMELVEDRRESSGMQKTHSSPKPRHQSDQKLATINGSLGSRNSALDLEGYLDDQTRNAPFLSGRQSSALLETMAGVGSLILHLRRDDLAHCESVLTRLSARPRSISLERRIQLELKDLITKISGEFDPILPTRGCSMAPIGDNIYEWRAIIKGPTQTPYEGGIFKIRV